jgi:hypothetical protein
LASVEAIASDSKTAADLDCGFKAHVAVAAILKAVGGDQAATVAVRASFEFF